MAYHVHLTVRRIGNNYGTEAKVNKHTFIEKVPDDYDKRAITYHNDTDPTDGSIPQPQKTIKVRCSKHSDITIFNNPFELKVGMDIPPGESRTISVEPFIGIKETPTKAPPYVEERKVKLEFDPPFFQPGPQPTDVIIWC